MLQYGALVYLASNGLVSALSIWATLKVLTLVRVGGGGSVVGLGDCISYGQAGAVKLRNLVQSKPLGPAAWYSLQACLHTSTSTKLACTACTAVDLIMSLPATYPQVSTATTCPQLLHTFQRASVQSMRQLGHGHLLTSSSSSGLQQHRQPCQLLLQQQQSLQGQGLSRGYTGAALKGLQMAVMAAPQAPAHTAAMGPTTHSALQISGSKGHRHHLMVRLQGRRRRITAHTATTTTTSSTLSTC
jgi:hypothetical protein